MATKKTKEEITTELVSDLVGAGQQGELETVDFSDPHRPKTCIEVDFPILKINQIAGLEARSGAATKPIYQSMKYWARRQSSVFRSLLLSSATKAPDDDAEAAEIIWQSYYKNHSQNSKFGKLNIVDVFMGGGTTVVEASRLGMNVKGNDLNPLSWLVVKNELSNVDEDELETLFREIENEVKPQIVPFYQCDGPNGEKGIWKKLSTGEVMGDSFDPLALLPEQRKDYEYEGPEVIYTFWAKHGPCKSTGCNHRTPLISSSIVAEKNISTKYWQDRKCAGCGDVFDLELKQVRISPDSKYVVSVDETPFTYLGEGGEYSCPHCGFSHVDEIAYIKGESNYLPKKLLKSKKVKLSLLINRDWVVGDSGRDSKGELGGTNESSAEHTNRWNAQRMESVELIEYRGNLLDEFNIDGQVIKPGFGTIPKQAHFTCMNDTCGLEQKTLKSIQLTETNAPLSPYALQCYSPSRHENGEVYSGRFFKSFSEKDISRLCKAYEEWEERSVTDLAEYWPKTEIPFGHKTHERDPLPKHGIKKWSHFFNSRQLYVHSLILKAIDKASGYSLETKLAALAAFQQYLRSNCAFTFYHKKNDQAAKFLSNNDLNPKNNVLEVGVFNSMGDGTFSSAMNALRKAVTWKKNPWELVVKGNLDAEAPDVAALLKGESVKVYPGDPVVPTEDLFCGSSTELNRIETNTIDLVITDPPFGDNLQYSEFSDYFYVWLRLVLKDYFPEIFSSEYTPKTLEAVSNSARHPDDPDAFYKRLLTGCWAESARILKASGLLVFTFHHSEDEPWIDVLDSLFAAGFYLEATYPIRSDQSKGDKAQFGSQKIEYDIVHVCRKRSEEPTKISWARLRRRMLSDIRQLQTLLEHHQNEGLPLADIQVIKRGKALEYFSRHYGQVYVEEGREFTVNEALVGINQILDDQSESESGSTPVVCEPNTRQFLRIFARQSSVERDQMQKFLRGSGIAPSTFVSLGWATETTRPKAFHWRSPLEIAKERMSSNRTVSRDFDQAMLLVGACYPESGINTKKILDESFKPHPALGHLLDWLVHNGADSTMRTATITARQLYTRWEAEHQSVLQEQISLFGMEDEL